MSRATSTPPRSRWAALAATGLVAALVPAVGLGSPAGADPSCTTETAPRDPVLGIPTAAHCDDTMAPETKVTGSTPAITPDATGTGWATESTVSFTFTGNHPPEDATDDDPIAFECRLFQGADPGPTSGWQACTSPAQFSALKQTATTPYTFEVRAVDSVDAATDITSYMVPGTGPLPLPVLNPFPADVDVPDHDTTAEKVTFLVDSVRPQESRVVGVPFDHVNPNWPMIKDDRLDLQLLPEAEQDGSALSYRCTVDEEPVACQAGAVTLTDLTGGDHIFESAAYDRAGNRERRPARVFFSVPRDLETRRGPWRTRQEEGAFGGDHLQARREGAAVGFRVRDVKEIRLLAPTGPKQGKVEVYVGNRLLRTVNLRAKRYRPMRVHYLRGWDLPRTVSGRLEVRVVKVPRRGYVRVDAVLAH